MVKISFTKGRPAISVAEGQNLMQSLLDNGVPVASSCGGVGVCAKCKIQISKGRENLTPPNSDEKDLQEIHDLKSNERISCQTQILGDITIDATYW